jgi:hypothetical protein
LLDSGVVDVTMSYNAMCTSRIILEGIVFQELYKRVEPSKRPCEPKTLESNKSLIGNVQSWQELLGTTVQSTSLIAAGNFLLDFPGTEIFRLVLELGDFVKPWSILQQAI